MIHTRAGELREVVTSVRGYDWLKIELTVALFCCDRAIRAKLFGAAAKGSILLAVELSQFSASDADWLGGVSQGFTCK